MKLLNKDAIANRVPIVTIIILWPNRSIKRPTKIIRKPASNVAIEYTLETSDLDHPKSWIYSSMNCELEYVCPGPEKKTPKPAMIKINQP